MTASLDTLVVAAYVFADSLVIARSGPVGKISDAELVALSVAQAVIGVRTLLSCANYAGCAQHSLFAGYAGYGYCPSKSQWYWGMRLVLMSDRNGVPVGYDLTPAGEREYEATYRLAQAHPGATLFADKGLWGAEYHASLELIDIHLVTPTATASASDPHARSKRPASAWSSSPSSPT